MVAQRITWVSPGTGREMIATCRLGTTLGKTYRVTGTIDTSALPAGTPVECRIGYSSGLERRDTIERSLLGQWTGYADGTIQNIDIRWTAFTDNGACYFGTYVTDAYLSRNDALRRPGAGQGDHVSVRDLVFEEFSDTLHGAVLDATAEQNTIRKNGVEFTFNRDVRIGLYANRDYWFRDLDPGNATPLRITSIWPECATHYLNRVADGVNSDGDTIWKITPSTSPTDDFFTVHGTEVNPWKEGWEWRTSPNDGPVVQAFEDRFDTSIRTLGAPYKSPIHQKRWYDDSYNKDPGRTGSPLDVSPGDTVVKALSYVEPPARFGGSETRARVAALIPVTCVDTDPPAGSFRPYPGAADKTPTHNISEINTAILPDLASPALPNSPEWHEAARMAAFFQPANLRQFPPNEGLVGGLASSGYSREHTSETCRHMMGGLISDAFTPAQKSELAVAVAQYGLDLYQDNLIRKIAWAESGGKLCKKPFAVVASLLLQDAAMQAEIARSDGQFDVTRNPDLPEADRIYPWYEDCLWGFLPAECVDVPRDLYISSAGKARHGMKYFPENVGMPSLQDSGSRWEPWTTPTLGKHGNPQGLNGWNASYRSIGTNRAQLGIVAMHVIPGARAVFNNDAPLDWYDMYYRLSCETGDAFTENMLDYDRAFWSQHRSAGAPVAVHRFGLDDETVYDAAAAAAIMSDDYEAETGRPMTAADWKSTPPLGVPRLRKFPVSMAMSFPLAPEWFVRAGTTDQSWLDVATVPTGYSLVSGTLPAGLSLNVSTGAIEGTPAEESPLRPDLPDDPTDRASPATIRATDIVVRATNASGSSEQLIRFAVVA